MKTTTPTLSQKQADLEDFATTYGLTLPKSIVAGDRISVLSAWRRLQTWARNQGGCHINDVYTTKLSYVF